MTQVRMRHLPILLCLVLSACVVPGSVTRHYPSDSLPTRPWPASATCPTPARAGAEAEALLALMNQARVAAGLGPLTPDPGVTEAARKHACENAARATLDHEGPDGADLLERYRREGIYPRLAAENTGLGYPSAEAAFAGWMASPPHRANILRPEVSLVGIGLADGAQPVWVVDLLAPR